jgi:hypothetical protein
MDFATKMRRSRGGPTAGRTSKKIPPLDPATLRFLADEHERLATQYWERSEEWEKLARRREASPVPPPRSTADACWRTAREWRERAELEARHVRLYRRRANRMEQGR